MITVGGLNPETPLAAAEKVLVPHQTRNPVATVTTATLPQCVLDPRAAIGLAAGLMNLLNERQQVSVLDSPDAGVSLPVLPIIIAAGRDAQDPAQETGRVF
jgi:hypothetical protein